MSYNTAIALIEGLVPEQLEAVLADGFATSDEHLDFEAASSKRLREALAITQIGRWLVVWNPLYEAIKPLRRSATGRYLSLTLAGVSDMYSFEAYRGDTLLREACRTEGELRYEEGEPLPEEAGLPPCGSGLDEDRQFDLIKACLGGSLAPLYEASYRRWPTKPS